MIDAATMGRTGRWTWPDWPTGLYEDTEHFHFDGGVLTRAKFDACAAAVGERDAAVLLDNLVSDGTLDLGPDMAGIVAAVWAATYNAETVLSRSQWVDLFHANGFSREGRRSDPPAGPLRLFRGCVPGFRYTDTDRLPVEVDDFGRPVVDLDLETVDTRTGMSWAADVLTARSLLRTTPAGRAHGRVFAAMIGPTKLLAIIGTEFVVDNTGLTVTEVPR